MSSFNASSRHPASAAMIELRKAMGKTQTTFAVEVVDMAVSTVARFETRDPPAGDVLLRLAEIAGQNGQARLRDTFRELYLEDVRQKIDARLIMMPRTETSMERGFLFLKLEGAADLRGAQSFLALLDTSRDAAPALRKRANKLLVEFNKAARGLKSKEREGWDDANLQHVIEGDPK